MLSALSNQGGHDHTATGQILAWNAQEFTDSMGIQVVAQTTQQTQGPPDASKAVSFAAEAILDAGRSRALELANMFAAQAGQGSSEGNKRKLEDFGVVDAPDLKRPASEGLGVTSVLSMVPTGLPSTFILADIGSSTETIMCPADKVGRIIGRAGATIRDLEASTSTRVQVDHKVPGEKPVVISGRRDDVDRAKKTILDLISSTGDATSAQGEAHKALECPAGIVGRIIGRGGETIRTLQQASGAHIMVNQDFPEGIPRQITISGSHDAVARATSMVTELISGDINSTQSIVQRFGVGVTEVMECPRAMVGRIIGKGGETIKDLQKRFNTSIQIDQTSTPCRVTITGPAQIIQSARRAVEDLIRQSNIPPIGGSRPGPSYPAPYSHSSYSGVSSAPYGGYSSYGVPPGYPALTGYPPYGAYSGYPPAAAPFGGYGGYIAPGDSYTSTTSYGHAYTLSSSHPALVVPGQAPSTGSVWQSLQDDHGRTYYYNSQTGVSQWEKPPDMS